MLAFTGLDSVYGQAVWPSPSRAPFNVCEGKTFPVTFVSALLAIFHDVVAALMHFHEKKDLHSIRRPGTGTIQPGARFSSSLNVQTPEN